MKDDHIPIPTGKSQATYERAKEIIPGGTQLLSKRPEMFLPGFWPAYYEKAEGCRLWDLDGRCYVDAALMGVGANVLGYCDPDVDKAVVDAVRKGTNTTLNCPEEVELAELLLSLHPWADSVRYTRTGGEAMAVAVRIARAATGRDKVLFCGYHGWHDWYLSANLTGDRLKDGHLLPGLEPRGVPRGLLDTAIPFGYNGTDEFLDKMRMHGDESACVVLESVRNFEPEDIFFEAVRRETRKRNIVLIVDEITAGFRLGIGGAHLRYGLVPDIAVFGKAMANGYPLGAVIGTSEVMEAAQKSFISSLFWTERIGPAAALSTVRKMQSIDSPARLRAIGEKVRSGWTDAAGRTGVSIKVSGTPAITGFAFGHPDVLELKTVFTQEMLKRGYLATTAFYVSCSHEGYTADYLSNVEAVFAWIAAQLEAGRRPAELLDGDVCHSGFKRLT